MILLRFFDRIIFLVLFAGMLYVGWRAMHPATDQLAQQYGSALNEQRQRLYLRPVGEDDQLTLRKNGNEVTQIDWRPKIFPNTSRPYFLKKEVFLQHKKLIQETDTYLFPFKKGTQRLHFDYFPDSIPARQFRARLEVEGLPSIQSFEIPYAPAAITFKDSLLAEWKL
ncbi:MAG: hypothetical protein QM669_14390 [Siphonobacter sp.]